MTGLLAITGPGHVVALILVPLAGIYVTCNIGFSGGPNHGDHPFIVNIIHFIAFLIQAQHWPRPQFWSYFGILVAALALSVVVLERRGGWKDRDILAPRLVMAAFYAGLVGILAFGER